MRLALVVLALLVSACNRGGSVVGPEPTPLEAVPPALSVPSQLRTVWATPDRALARAAQFQANAIILQIDTWGTDVSPVAAALRQRGVGALVYVEQCFTLPRSGWDACWSNVEKWSKPLKEEGILFGFHVMDEPAMKGLGGIRDEANAYVRSRGYDVFATEWIEYVSDQKQWHLPRPNVRWYGVTCYQYGSRTPWTVQGCSEEYTRHKDWDTVVVPASSDVCTGGKCDTRAWENLAASQNRGLAYWITD